SAVLPTVVCGRRAVNRRTNRSASVDPFATQMPFVYVRRDAAYLLRASNRSSKRCLDRAIAERRDCGWLGDFYRGLKYVRPHLAGVIGENESGTSDSGREWEETDDDLSMGRARHLSVLCGRYSVCRYRMRSVLLLFHYNQNQKDCNAEFYADFYHRSVTHADADGDSDRYRHQDCDCYRHCDRDLNGDPNSDAHTNPDDDYGDARGRDLSYFGRIGNALRGGKCLRRERHRAGHDDF